ncbi:uncharacterized protein LOC131935207 [Physella acuta]|uniref:uncharacterized protein LOC131935207 n=1 Tax=Physella acuta TaxID=109671 RepID=UPI0027DB16C3|nr:uncharacterized protein LOC131935207 [Physella acuta]
MQLCLFVALVLPFVLAQPDPTTVCLPNQLQSDLYDFDKTDFGTVAADFTKNMTSLRFVKTNIRVVYDLLAGKGYLVSGTGECTSFDLQASQVITQCLPASATPLTTNDTVIGFGATSLKLVSYDVQFDDKTKVRAAFTDSTPAFPVLRQVIGTSTNITGDVLFFTNSKTTVDNDLFIVPTVCTPLTAV